MLTLLEFCGSIFLLIFAFERGTKAVDRVRRLRRESSFEVASDENALHMGVEDGLE